jgi:hypothetical protein
LEKSKYYRIGFNSKVSIINFIDELFNKWIFCRWIFYGIWQGSLIYFVGFYTMQYINAERVGASSEMV